MPAPKKRPPRRPALSKLELSVMDTVWLLGECTSRAVVEAYQKRRKLAVTTIRTVLNKLVEKGYVEVVPTTTREYLYRAVIRQDEVRRATYRDLIANLFNGSPKEAMLFLIESERLDEKAVAEIERMLADFKKRRKAP